MLEQVEMTVFDQHKKMPKGFSLWAKYHQDNDEPCSLGRRGYTINLIAD